jgi:hypothetical protein
VVCVKETEADFDDDCRDGFLDYRLFAESWLDCNLDSKETCFD